MAHYAIEIDYDDWSDLDLADGKAAAFRAARLIAREDGVRAVRVYPADAAGRGDPLLTVNSYCHEGATWSANPAEIA